MTVRVRFAPSPTGHLHIGSVRTALFNYLFAQHHGGEFILRFEDTDTERNVPGADDEIISGFLWLGLNWTEGPDIGGQFGPYRCTERLPIYTEYLQKLLASGLAYPCYCSAEELAEAREKAQEEGGMPRYSGKCRHLTEAERHEKEAAGIQPNYRFATMPGVELAFDDMIRGHVSFASDDTGDFVIVKSNGIPTYNFQVVIDDALMKITHVIRGEEHLSNTPRQLLVYQALGFTPPVFGHLPTVLDRNRKKLSKRDPNVMPVHAYREQGYVPAAIINFLALLGWSPEGEEEILSMEQISAAFDTDRINKSGAIFDVDKLHWMANQYLKHLPLETLTEMVRRLLPTQRVTIPDGMSESWLQLVVALYQEQMSSAIDFFALTKCFFEEHVKYDDEAREVLQEPSAGDVIRMYRQLAAADDAWTPEASKARFKQVQKELGVKGQHLFMPVRAAVTGAIHGRDLQQTIAYLPKTWVLERLDRALAPH